MFVFCILGSCWFIVFFWQDLIGKDWVLKNLARSKTSKNYQHTRKFRIKSGCYEAVSYIVRAYLGKWSR